MKVECKCIICGKTFYQYPSRVKQGIKCCSNDCRSKRITGKGNHNYNGGHTDTFRVHTDGRIELLFTTGALNASNYHFITTSFLND